ncbi:MAG: molecular chaperone DnaJ [Thermoleophilaceae bacterium]|nr:molecular chaperone DnaJ [Thermoleophilaceae bacterium]
MTTTRDYYEVLGVGRDADEKAIKKAFRQLARELHPDVNDSTDAEEQFKDVAAAYEVLSDPERRATYDRYGHEGLRSSGGEPDFSGFDGFSSVFEAFFGGSGGMFGGGARNGPADGADVVVAAQIELADVLSGKKIEIEYDYVSTCEHCDGSRAEPGSEVITCERCGGAGVLHAVTRTPLGQIKRQVACNVCNGSGSEVKTPCKQCRGKGRVQSSQTVSVEIPAGIEEGQQVRLHGRGHAGVNGGGPGDLYVQVQIAENKNLHREGRDLYAMVDLPVHDAMLGATYEVETLDGVADIEFKPGTANGDRVTLQGRGVPGLRDTRRGAFHAVVNLVVPRNLNQEQRELIEQFGETITEHNLHSNEHEGLFSRLRRVLR